MVVKVISFLGENRSVGSIKIICQPNGLFSFSLLVGIPQCRELDLHIYGCYKINCTFYKKYYIVTSESHRLLFAVYGVLAIARDFSACF